MAVSKCKCRLICFLSVTLVLSCDLVQNVFGTEADIPSPFGDDDLLDFPLINAAEPRAKRTLFSGGENADLEAQDEIKGVEFESFAKFITSKK